MYVRRPLCPADIRCTNRAPRGHATGDVSGLSKRGSSMKVRESDAIVRRLVGESVHAQGRLE
jgi:hypothetical protein